MFALLLPAGTYAPEGAGENCPQCGHTHAGGRRLQLCAQLCSLWAHSEEAGRPGPPGTSRLPLKMYPGAIRTHLTVLRLQALSVAERNSPAPRFLIPAPRLQELNNDPLNILRPASKLQHSLNLASAYCSPPEHHESENRRGRRHDAKPHEPKVSLELALLNQSSSPRTCCMLGLLRTQDVGCAARQCRTEVSRRQDVCISLWLLTL